MDEESIFLQALQKPTSADRVAFLDQACAGKAELRRDVEGLLQAHERAGDFLHANPGIVTTDQPITECPGTVIGRYKILEQIGEGGFGVVFMAEQQQPVRRKVALKVLKPGMDTRQVIARFEAERQALALMDHPNIARVFDGGETAGGRPYFVMELVKGIPITDYCDEGQLTARNRLDLFTHVCQAVQHAHQKGIIHRDLKPSNVLVTLHDGTPVVKVIDFGIAKATGQQLTEKTLFTNFAQLVGTPLYMSPEQAALSGLDVDTRSDIYSLGVLLYELLTGTTPFDKERFKKAGYDEIRRIIREEEPPRPSTRISTLAQAATRLSMQRQSDPQRLSQLFRGELDWIVMKCLDKDRNRRYETASALAMDIQRYLHDEPVQACPPSAMYRFRKFARRNTRALVTTMTLVLGLLFALGGLVSAVLVQSASNAQIRLKQKQTNDALGRETKAKDELLRVVAAKQLDLYFQGIALAERELAVNNVARADRLLDECAQELRGWEWHYLKRYCRARVPPLAHDAAVYCVAISRSGEFLASSDVEGGVTLWDARTYRQLRPIPAHTLPSWSVTFSPDGHRLASAGEDGTIKIWDVRTGKRLLELPGNGRPVFSVSFSPDGRLASLGGAGLTLLDGASGKTLFSRPDYAGNGRVVFSPDGRRLASVGVDRDAKVWDAGTGQLIRSFPGPDLGPTCVAFSPDGRLLAAGSGMLGYRKNGELRIWDAETGQELPRPGGHGELVLGLAFSPDGRRLVSGALDQTIKVWDVQTGREALSLREHVNMLNSLVFSADGRLFSGNDDRTVRVWDGRDWHAGEGGEEILTLAEHDEAVDSVAFSRLGDCFASADCQGIIKLRSGPDLWKNRASAVRTLKASDEAVHGIAFSPDGTLLATVGENAVRLWQASTGKKIHDLHTGDGNFMCVAFSPNGRYLAAAGWIDDSLVRIWNVKSGDKTHQLQGHKTAVNSVAFTPKDGRYLVTGGEDGTVRVWDWAADKELRQLGPRQLPVYAVAFSPDGMRLACGGLDRTVRTWDTSSPDPRNWKQLLPLADATGSVECVAFSPDGRHLAWGGTDSTVKICAIDRERAAAVSPSIHVFYGHVNWVRTVAFSLDGRHVVSGSQDGTVKIWAVPSE